MNVAQHFLLAFNGLACRIYIRENEFLRETILICLSGAQMGWINEIKNAKKFRDTATLS